MKYKGFYGIDLTTAGHLENPREVFEITNELNKERKPSSWIGIELYPMIQRRILPKKVLGVVNVLLGKYGVLPQGINTEDILAWRKEFPNTVIERIHLPFCANNSELWFRAFVGELENGLGQVANTIPFIFFFGAAENNKAIRMAEDLRVGINAHVNVADFLVRSGRLKEIRKKVPFFLIENDINYKSLIVKKRKLLYDPVSIVEEYVGVVPEIDGMLLGLDHFKGSVEDLLDLLNQNILQKNLYAIHLAHPAGKGDVSHDVVDLNDHEFKGFLEKASNTLFSHPVRIALDYNPIVLGKMSYDQKLSFYKKTIEWLEDTQGINK